MLDESTTQFTFTASATWTPTTARTPTTLSPIWYVIRHRAILCFYRPPYILIASYSHRPSSPSRPPPLLPQAGAVGSVTQLAQIDAGEDTKDFLNGLATSKILKKTINDHSPCIGTTQEGGVDKFLSTYAARVKEWYGSN